MEERARFFWLLSVVPSCSKMTGGPPAFVVRRILDFRPSSKKRYAYVAQRGFASTKKPAGGRRTDGHGDGVLPSVQRRRPGCLRVEAFQSENECSYLPLFSPVVCGGSRADNDNSVLKEAGVLW